MRGFVDSQNEKVGRLILYVLQNLLVCITSRDERPWITKLFRLFRHNRIQSAIKFLSYLIQVARMKDGSAFDHVEHINFCSHNPRK